MLATARDDFRTGFAPGLRGTTRERLRAASRCGALRLLTRVRYDGPFYAAKMYRTKRCMAVVSTYEAMLLLDARGRCPRPMPEADARG